MSEWVVDIEHITSEVKTFYVEAENEREAEEKALKMADASNWKAPGGEFEVLIAEVKDGISQRGGVHT